MTASSGILKKSTIECGVAASISTLPNAYFSPIDLLNATTKCIPQTRKTTSPQQGCSGPVYISVVYVERGTRKRIISAFEADDDDITDYMVTYAIIE